MQRIRLTLLFLATLVLGGVAASRAQQPARAEYPGIETGKMWTFDAPPLAYWAKRYDFHPTQTWLDHAMHSAARLPGCSASFVSPDGLVMSNHHCARGCIDAVGRPGEDLLTNGFYAASRAEERKCPGMYLDQLLQITDVTDSVNAAVPPGTPSGRAAKLRETEIGNLEQHCQADAADIRCQVVTMYAGGEYKLYRFHHYTDLRLVFAVESQTAFFGGDPDNFTYPRYDLDISIVRAYENDQPANTSADYFKWSQAGAKDSELVFVVGNPGSTGRLNTLAQLEYLRDIQYPASLTQLGNMIAVYQAQAAQSPERARALENTLFYLQNSYKAISGYQAGLLDSTLMARKRAWERSFRARVNANPRWRLRYGSAWQTSALDWQQLRALALRRRYYSFNAYGTTLLQEAGLIVRYPAQMAKPDSAREPIYRDAMKPRLERVLQAPVDTAAEIAMLGAYFTQMKKDLPATDPLLRRVLAGRAPDDAAREMVTSSEILSPAQRQALIEGGAAAIRASTDPFIELARYISPVEESLTRQATAINDREAQASALIARALLAVFGNTVAPDATFSLRISDGQVLGYPYNGTLAPPFTTFYGMYNRYYAFGASAASPWNLMPRWLQMRDSFNLATPLDAVSTNDIIGGNSGSPVINANGEIVGLIFDGNIEAQPLRFLFSEAVGRSVWVDSRGIIEALRHVYGAGALADEMTGR